MDESKIKLVQSSWETVETISDQAAVLFYDKLFELNPSLRALFPAEMADQRAKLMKTIGIAVRGLNKLDAIVPVLQDLGRRHAADYDVSEKDYDTVGAALLWTLGKGLGDAFDAEIREAWAETYALLADTMKDAARAASV